jgi:DNA-binding transcriptional ArsR family regulator
MYELLNYKSRAVILEVVRPLIHPALEDITVEGVLHALSDPVRASIFSDIAASACPQTCSSYLKVSDRNIPKSTLSQHFKALRDAGLIRSERQGVEMHNTSRCLELERRFPGLISAIVNAHSVQTTERRKAAKSARKTVASRVR